MNKNIVIAYLVIVIVVLVGFIMISNYELFSEEWGISLVVILGAIGVGIGIAFFKIRK